MRFYFEDDPGGRWKPWGYVVLVVIIIILAVAHGLR